MAHDGEAIAGDSLSESFDEKARRDLARLSKPKVLGRANALRTAMEITAGNSSCADFDRMRPVVGCIQQLTRNAGAAKISGWNSGCKRIARPASLCLPRHAVLCALRIPTHRSRQPAYRLASNQRFAKHRRPAGCSTSGNLAPRQRDLARSPSRSKRVRRRSARGIRQQVVAEAGST